MNYLLLFVIIIVMAAGGFFFMVFKSQQSANSLSRVANNVLNSQTRKQYYTKASFLDNIPLWNIFSQYFLPMLRGDADFRRRCISAGFRTEAKMLTLYIMRYVCGIILALLAFAYCIVLKGGTFSNAGMYLALGGLVGYFLPVLYISNVCTKRKQELTDRFMDMVDLLLVCLSAGMSLEAAMQRVYEEMVPISPVMGDELGVTLAELSFLSDRVHAYENLSTRTDVDFFKAFVTVLVQSERYGTPLVQSLKALSQECRMAFFQEMERKAMALPPKMTVPMIFFFMPVMFIIILAPIVVNGLGLPS